MTKEQIKEELLANTLQLTDVIDCIIELNGFVGVGLITFGAQIEDCITSKINRNISFD